MDGYTPIIIIELILVFGGVLLFAWWQFHDLKKEREKKAANSDQNSNRSDSEKC